MSIQMNVLRDIGRERDYQDARWGTKFDDKNTLNDWCTFIGRYCGKASGCVSTGPGQRVCLVQVAALAVAALEAHDRNNGFPPRHYDEEAG